MANMIAILLFKAKAFIFFYSCERIGLFFLSKEAKTVSNIIAIGNNSLKDFYVIQCEKNSQHTYTGTIKETDVNKRNALHKMLYNR